MAPHEILVKNTRLQVLFELSDDSIECSIVLKQFLSDKSFIQCILPKATMSKKNILISFISLLTLGLFINIGFSLNKSTNDSSEKNYTITNTTTGEEQNQIEVSIKYHNKMIYYVDEPIIVEFQITNRGYDPFLFITSFNKIFTFDFDVLTTTNRKIEHSKEYIIQSTQFEPVLSDEITLKRDEVYGVRIDLSRWFDLRDPGDYVIRGVFYPNLKTGSVDDIKLYSRNELYLTLNPPFSEEVKKKKEIEEIKKLKAESLPPYDVVNYMLKALQERDFEKYFLFIKFEKFIMQFQNSSKKYMEARDIDKPAVIEEFKQYLMGKNRLEAIPFSETIPADYDILRTVVEKRDAVVTVIETFKYINLVEKKQYTYYLHLYGDKWLLESYSVVNISE